MLSLEEIKRHYPEALHPFGRFMLREYLQVIILGIIFESKWGTKLSFLGGTCLRLVHDNKRFSEDLDFDFFELSSIEFESLGKHLADQLQQRGYKIERRTVHKGAYHCYVRFPGLLFDEALSGHFEEKVLIQLDAEAHGFEYLPDQPILNRFDTLIQISATPPSILLAQKFYAVLNRKRNKGRDFFDVVFLLGRGYLPDYEYLKLKTGLSDWKSLLAAINAHCTKLNMPDMAKDVKPFLFHPADAKKVELFLPYLQGIAR